VRRQTYGYFPSFRTSPPLHQYKIILLRDRSRHASAACPVLCSTAQVRLVCLSARPRSESESSFLTAHQSLVSGWSESLDSITNHLAKLQFESPSVSETSDAGHDLLCCCLVADEVEFLVFIVLMKFSTPEPVVKDLATGLEH